MRINKNYRLQPVVTVDTNITLIAMQIFNMKVINFLSIYLFFIFYFLVNPILISHTSIHS